MPGLKKTVNPNPDGAQSAHQNEKPPRVGSRWLYLGDTEIGSFGPRPIIVTRTRANDPGMHRHGMAFRFEDTGHEDQIVWFRNDLLVEASR